MTICSAVSSAFTAVIRTRGVMTSAAECSEKRRVRCNRTAWSTSSTPSSADRRTSELSSSALRAPDSSSFGSMPNDLMMPLAVLLNSRMTGLKTAVNRAWKGTTILAVARGRASAKFFGTSSPITIEKMVARKIPATAPIPGTTDSGRPAASNGPLSILLMAGSKV
ncbi:hypothetical protein D9M72_493540 [compost metagenome]